MPKQIHFIFSGVMAIRLFVERQIGALGLALRSMRKHLGRLTAVILDSEVAGDRIIALGNVMLHPLGAQPVLIGEIKTFFNNSTQAMDQSNAKRIRRTRVSSGR